MMRQTICAECGKVINFKTPVAADVCFCAGCPHPIHDGDYYRDDTGKLCYTPKEKAEVTE
jgi:hypothetical protein